MNEQCNDSGFNSANEMNIDNIFFYEDNCSLQESANDDQHGCESMESHSQQATTDANVRKQKKLKDSAFTQIKVNVGIDEDLKMILDMDPSLIDGGILEKAVEPVTHKDTKVAGLPPKM
jgi:hypothetical protein